MPLFIENLCANIECPDVLVNIFFDFLKCFQTIGSYAPESPIAFMHIFPFLSLSGEQHWELSPLGRLPLVGSPLSLIW
jgi:hypothetical protein